MWTVPEVKHWIGAGPSLGTKLNQTQNAGIKCMAARLRLIRAVAERERAQNDS